MTPFPPIDFNTKGTAKNGRNPPYCPYPALITPFLDVAFINEEPTGAIHIDNHRTKKSTF